MMDDLNKLPVDPAWVKKVTEVTEHAARELQCMVVLIAIQDGGKLAVEVNGIPTSGPLHDLAQDPPAMLATLSVVCKMQDDFLRQARH